MVKITSFNGMISIGLNEDNFHTISGDGISESVTFNKKNVIIEYLDTFWNTDVTRNDSFSPVELNPPKQARGFSNQTTTFLIYLFITSK